MRSKYEKETIILFNEGEDEARIYTHNARMKSKLKELAASSPDECKYVDCNEDGGVTYEITKNLISIRKPYSEERRMKDRERAVSENKIRNCRK